MSGQMRRETALTAILAVACFALGFALGFAAAEWADEPPGFGTHVELIEGWTR